jgi:hypothetical protein
MPASSQTIIPSTTHNGQNTDPVTITSDPYKGSGYFGFGFGLHTVSYQTTNFIGNIKIQATLASTPGESDWFDVGETIQDNEVATTAANIYSFTGNFVWVRATLTYTAGTVNKISYNY